MSNYWRAPHPAANSWTREIASGLGLILFLAALFTIFCVGLGQQPWG